MNTKRILVSLAILGLWINTINAQSGKSWRNGKPVTTEYHHNWSVGAGFNIVDDSGKTIGGIINPGRYWNFSVPFYINAEYYLNNKFSFNAMLSTNKYIEGKQIELGYIIEGHEASYFAADLTAKFSFRDYLHTYIFDPYVFLGFGYSSIGAYKTDPIAYGSDEIRDVPATGQFNLDFGVGFNIWFSQSWGLNLNLAGKIALSSGEFNSNHKQYALGVVYLFN